MRVEIYWNLHRSCFSIRSLEGADKGRVVAHASKVLVREATFAVREAGRRKVVETGTKNVHAFVRGELEACLLIEERWPYRDHWDASDSRYQLFASQHGMPVKYDPRKGPFFMARPDHTVEAWGPITDAPMALLSTIQKRARMVAFDPCQMPEEA